MSLIAGVAAPLTWVGNRYFDDPTPVHSYHGAPIGHLTPSGGTIALYAGAILLGVVAVLGLVAAVISAIRGVASGTCPACGSEIIPVPAGAARLTCTSCQRILKIADGSLAEMDAPATSGAVN